MYARAIKRAMVAEATSGIDLDPPGVPEWVITARR